MLKSVLYYVMLITTSVRFGYMVYLLSASSTNLPVPVLFVTSLMILLGFALIIKKYISSLFLKNMTMYYILNTVAISFNLIYTAVTCPLKITLPEMLITGTLLDVIVSVSLLYFCFKRIRSRYFAAEPIVVEQRHINV